MPQRTPNEPAISSARKPTAGSQNPIPQPLSTPATRIKSFVRKILLASPAFPRLYADVVISSAPNSNEAKILAHNYKKIVALSNERNTQMSHPRSCTHIKVTGVRCGSPALRGEQFCYFHQRMLCSVRLPQLPRPPLRPARRPRIHPGLPHGGRQRTASWHPRTQARRAHSPRPQHRRPQHPPRPLRSPPGRNDPRAPQLPRTSPRPTSTSHTNPPRPHAAHLREKKSPASEKPTWPHTSAAPTKSPQPTSQHPQPMPPRTERAPKPTPAHVGTDAFVRPGFAGTGLVRAGFVKTGFVGTAAPGCPGGPGVPGRSAVPPKPTKATTPELNRKPPVNVNREARNAKAELANVKSESRSLITPAPKERKNTAHRASGA